MRIVSATWVAVAFVLLAACSSTTSGTGRAGGGTGGGGAAQPTLTAPGSGPAVMPTGTAANSPFCRAYRAIGTRVAITPAEASRLADAYQQLEDTAPDSLRPDLDLIVKQYRSLASGTPDVNHLKQYVAALGRVARYAFSHCV